MPQSLARNLIHLVYTTKNRAPAIIKKVQPKLYAYQIGIFHKLDCHVECIGGVEDHVHTLFVLSKNYALKKVIEEVKKDSSKWMKTQEGLSGLFHWQNGYGAFSVSQSQVGRVVRYINTQEDHHRKMSVQDELRELFRRHQIEYDERYVWD